MNRNVHNLKTLFYLLCLFAVSSIGSAAGIINTKHNLSNTGPGDIKALTEDRICVFCHTPHNASPQTPLWNKDMKAKNYAGYPAYSSTTMVASPAGPTGPSRLCLSCHDGTIALGDVLLPPVQIAMNNQYPTGRSNFGASLASHHPVSFSYSASAANPEINPIPPVSELLFYNTDVIECSTCHDPHDNSNKKFLARSNENSGLCVLCHTKDGWSTASHSTSLGGWNQSAPNPWPRTGTGVPGFNSTWDFGWTTVKQNGCENCHAPHAAAGTSRLLNDAAEEENCYPCHNGHVDDGSLPLKDIKTQFSHASRHNVANYTGVHDPREALPVATTHVECADCHNPHASNSAGTAYAPPNVTGKLAKVSGVQQNGVSSITPALYEYEVCFKCHADTSTISPTVVRVIDTTKANRDFDTINPSYHPVIAPGKHPNPADVPSLPSSDAQAPAGLTVASYIYCTDCHSDEVVVANVLMSRGPHGSPYAPILRRQYRTTDNTAESAGNYALCYRCHERTNGSAGVLDDASFKKGILSSRTKGGHSGHLGAIVQAPCSACHDPHGVKDNGTTGSHTYLVNFDTSIVSALSGSFAYPDFTDNTGHSGNCTLVCHGVTHRSSTHNY